MAPHGRSWGILEQIGGNLCLILFPSFFRSVVPSFLLALCPRAPFPSFLLYLFPSFFNFLPVAFFLPYIVPSLILSPCLFPFLLLFFRIHRISFHESNFDYQFKANSDERKKKLRSLEASKLRSLRVPRQDSRSDNNLIDPTDRQSDRIAPNRIEPNQTEPNPTHAN